MGLYLGYFLQAQVVTTSPDIPTSANQVTVIFHADQGSKGLIDFTGDVYAHTGVITDKSTGNSDWKYVQSVWEVNIPKCKMTRISANTYELAITPDILQFYGVPQDESILKMAFVFRNSDGTKTGKDYGDKDILVNVFVDGVSNEVVIADPKKPNMANPATIYFYSDRGNKALMNHTGEIYAHTGVITSSSTGTGDWKYVQAEWTENTPKCKMVEVEPNIYKLDISPSIISFYGVPIGEKILQLAFVFRNSDGTKVAKTMDDEDIFVEVIDERLNIEITKPEQRVLTIDVGETLDFEALPSQGGFLQAFVNDKQVSSNGGLKLQFSHLFNSAGFYKVRTTVTVNNETAFDEIQVVAITDAINKPLPEGMKDGINYHDDDRSITLVLHAPYKKVVYYLGEQNNFELSDDYKMFKDAERWWITLDNLEIGKEYAYQYLVDGILKIADPYTEKILDPWNDSYIPPSIYPDLKAYPTEFTEGIVSIFQTAKQKYQWATDNFQMPATTDLIIYELLIRDFNANHSIKEVEQKLEYLRQLGVNAIELMPFNEFEGNDSWGYNPSFYFAPDKYYGTENAYKQFIDKAHEMGFAVIMDMVLNHSFGQHPLVQLYFNKDAGEWGQPTTENPWYNEYSPNPVYSWGYDLDHEAPATKAFIDRVIEYWITEYKVDGYRYDFTKGFTNTSGDGGAYDAARIRILKRIYDVQTAANPNSLMICEHFADNREETELANYGMLIWGNMNHSYSQAAMGYNEGANLSWGSYQQRGWNSPHLVTYSESHDEERMVFKSKNDGNSFNSYSVKKHSTALERAKLSSLFLFAVPGPKMLWQFQELGYDYSINHCPDGSNNEGCRISVKPIRWDYTDSLERKEVYNTIAMLSDIKKNYPIFSTTDFTMDVDGKLDKSITLSLGDEKVIALGNFDVKAVQMQADFTTTGWWFEFFSNDSLMVETSGTQFFNLQAGEYKLWSTQKFNSNNWPLPIDNNEADETNIFIYPNPAQNSITINTSTQNASIQIFNQVGQQVYQSNWSGNTKTVDISSFKNGLYIVRTLQKDKSLSTKLIIQH